MRKNASRGLCADHDVAWRKAGRPEREAWIADPANRPAGLSLDVASCLVAGCSYSGGLSRLCDLHLSGCNALHSRGQSIGVRQYAAAAEVLSRPAAGRCGFAGCDYEISRHGLCDGHHYPWTKVGRPPLPELRAELERRTTPSFSVAGLPPLVALEFQYLLQVRTDQRRSKVVPSSWVRAVNTVIADGATSVRDQPACHWRQLSLNHTTVPQLFTDLPEALGDLDGPAEEWDRDVWRPERLGYSIEERQQVAPLDFTGITQPWLRERTKRYMRLRLARTELRSVARNIHDVVVFSRFIAESRPDQQNDPAVLDRALLESYIGWVGRRTVEKKGPHYGLPVSPGSRIRLLSVISTMLETWRRYGWQPVLPPDARIHRDEYPRQRGLKANFIDEYLMEQIESEENLALLDPETRTLVLICRDEGLRIGEALTLKTDCLKKTPSGRWALVHYKSKDKSFRAIPASRVVVDAIRGQHGRVRERFSNGCHWLFPKVSGNPDGKYPMPYGTVDTRFDAWLKRIRLIDSNGDAAIVNWHQFRHTLGTRMANAGVSGRTIREVLGHTSWEMQEHYSRIADDTLRREYEEKYEVRFNLKGEAVKVRRDADLSGVEWLAEKIGRRLHAVAGGWCGRHIARPCPKTAADGCYFCEDFQTDRQFLPIHRDTLARTRELQIRATAAERPRAAGVNERLATAVEHVIGSITDQEHDELSPPPDGSEAVRHETERAADAG
ncbi:tyrosine-type recombinase/integrase [Streptomyces sp. NPDC001584]|uniref:tyrosine-type recombinase/integrase n=1 Tax=Streptomyces sp. NPDC001584 TaxID=3154521 RepID=UPI00332B1F3D